MPRDSAGSDRTRGSSRSKDDEKGDKRGKEKVHERRWNNLRLYYFTHQWHKSIKYQEFPCSFFENGNGRDVKPIVFKEVQWRKGMDFIIDYVSRDYGQRVKGVYTLDGDRVRDVEDLVHKGAYVLVYQNRPRFDGRNTYYLPENAVDTSFNDEKGEDEEKRDGSRDREDDKDRRRSESRSKSRDRSRERSRERSRDRSREKSRERNDSRDRRRSKSRSPTPKRSDSRSRTRSRNRRR